MSVETSQIDELGLQFDDCPSEAQLKQALDDAAVFVKSDGVSDVDENINLLRRLYAAHLLFLNGIVKVTESESIGDVSASFKTINTERNNSSPWFAKYLTLTAPQEMILCP